MYSNGKRLYHPRSIVTDHSHLGLSIQLVLCCVLIDSDQSLRKKFQSVRDMGPSSQAWAQAFFSLICV